MKFTVNMLLRLAFYIVRQALMRLELFASEVGRFLSRPITDILFSFDFPREMP